MYDIKHLLFSIGNKIACAKYCLRTTLCSIQMTQRRRVPCKKKCGNMLDNPEDIHCQRCKQIMAVCSEADGIIEEVIHENTHDDGEKVGKFGKSNLRVGSTGNIFKKGNSMLTLLNRFSSSIELTDSNKSSNKDRSRSYFKEFIAVFGTRNQSDIQEIFLKFIEDAKSSKNNESNKLAESFQTFCSKSVHKLLSVSDFNKAVGGNPDFMRICVERLLTSNLYQHYIERIIKSSNKDILFSRKIQSLEWVNVESLNVPKNLSDNPHAILHFCSAQNQLNLMTKFASPYDKLRSLLRCCKTLFKALEACSIGRIANADDFLPLLVYCVIKTNPLNINSQIAYIGKFSSPTSISCGESAYFFTSFTCAISFIENCNSDSFGISEEEYQKLINLHKSPAIKLIENIEKANENLEAYKIDLWKRGYLLEKDIKALKQKLQISS